MKTRFLLSSLAGAWLWLMVTTGCSHQSATPPEAAATPAATNQVPASTVTTTEPAEEPVEAAPDLKPFPPARPLPPGVAEVVELTQARVSDPVILEYIRSATNRLELSADDLVYLRDIGLKDPILTAMMEQGRLQRAESRSGGESETAPGVSSYAITPQPDHPTPGEIYLPPRWPGQGFTTSATEANAAPSTTAPPPSAPAPVTAYAPATEAVAPLAAEAADTTAAPVTYDNNYFYDALSPYGTWTEVAPYGMTWQPACSRLDPDWRPYCHGGRWVYTDSGWYWQSDYSWGWAPYHYGRWHHHGVYGWVWVPGRVWAPAWVLWRETDGYCGWAPMPPVAGWSYRFGVTWRADGFYHGMAGGIGCDWFTFVAYRDFCSPSLSRHYLRDRHAVNIYANSVVINNLRVGDRNTIFNHGVAPRQITAVTRQEVPKVPLEDIHGSGNSKLRPDRIDPASGRLAVFRPKLPGSELETPAQTSSPASRSRQELTKTTQPEKPASTLPIAASGRSPSPSTGLEPVKRPAVESPSKTTAGNPALPSGEHLAPGQPPSGAGLASRGRTDIEKPLAANSAGSPPPLATVAPTAPATSSKPSAVATDAQQRPPSQSTYQPLASRPLPPTPSKADSPEKPVTTAQQGRTVEGKTPVSTPPLPQSANRNGAGYAPLNPRPLPSASTAPAPRAADPVAAAPSVPVRRQATLPSSVAVSRPETSARPSLTPPSAGLSAPQTRPAQRPTAPTYQPPQAQTTLPSREVNRPAVSRASPNVSQRSGSEAFRSEPRKVEVAPPAFSAPKFADRPRSVDTGSRGAIPAAPSAPPSFSQPSSSRSFAPPAASAGPSRSYAPSAPAAAPRTVSPSPSRSSVVREAGPSAARSSGPPQGTHATPGSDARRGR